MESKELITLLVIRTSATGKKWHLQEVINLTSCDVDGFIMRLRALSRGKEIGDALEEMAVVAEERYICETDVPMVVKDRDLECSIRVR